jgi:lipopolysaccharide heptosyltransferase II
MAGWDDAAHLLCIRLDALGDVVMTTPAIRALKESKPGRRLTLLTSASGSSIARLVPEIDDVVTYAAPWMKATTPRADSRGDLAMADRLRAMRFDGAVIFTVYSQSPLPAAMLCHFADIPRRLAHCRENPYQLLTDWMAEPEPHALVRHEVRRQLDLVAGVGCTTDDERLSFHVSPHQRERARRKLAAAGVDLSTPWVVVHPGASAASRRYPVESYAQAVAGIAAATGHQFVVTGSTAEAPLVQAIADALPGRAHALAGSLELGELGAAIRDAELILCNNTGPAHIAAAVGTPVVDLYALTNPQHAPWQVASRVLYHDVPCRNCFKSVCPEGHHACLRGVAAPQVALAALELLTGVTARAPDQPLRAAGALSAA